MQDTRRRTTHLKKDGALNLHKNRNAPRNTNLIDRIDPIALAHIRVSAAKDAINAKSLAKVVKALKKRNIKIRFTTIEKGKPRKFLWDPAERRFTSMPNSRAREPSFTLLGPSLSLVEEHWHKLPIGPYVNSLTLRTVPIEKITPSNELSYICLLYTSPSPRDKRQSRMPSSA